MCGRAMHLAYFNTIFSDITHNASFKSMQVKVSRDTNEKMGVNIYDVEFPNVHMMLNYCKLYVMQSLII